MVHTITQMAITQLITMTAREARPTLLQMGMCIRSELWVELGGSLGKQVCFERRSGGQAQ